jgi:hypothetical protein
MTRRKIAIIATITAIAPAHGEWLVKQPDPAANGRGQGDRVSAACGSPSRDGGC